MRKITFLLAALFCLIGTGALAQDSERLTFGVISDIHFDNGVGEGAMVKVPQALKNLTSQGKLDALAIAGDLADAGRADQYEMLVSVFNDKSNYTNPVGDLLFMMGNHDHGNASGMSNYQNGLSVFNGGEPYPLHQYKVIKGYPFITISMMTSGSNAYPADLRKQLDTWLTQAASECPGKPIFVFTHVPPQWTVYGSWPEFENGSTWGMADLNSVLNKYPQAVVFAGHSHYPLGDPRSIHQGTNPDSPHKNYYTAINTASTTYGEIHPGAVAAGIHPENFAYATEGMIVSEMEDGNIEIRRFDTYRNTEIHPEKRWVLKAPFDGSMFEYADIRDAADNPDNVPLRNGLPAPAFTKSAEIGVEFVGGKAVVSFPQATDDECVFRYRLRIFKDGLGVTERFIFSQYYLYSGMPSELSYTITGLTKDSEYRVEVVAYDSYDNMSDPLMKTFKASSDVVSSGPDAQWKFDDPNNLLKGESDKFVMQPLTVGNHSVTLLESLEEAGITAVEGPEAGDGAIFMPKNSGLLMQRPEGSPATSDYTIMFYVKMPDAVSYNGLFQTNKNNNNDGELFIYRNKIGMNAMGGYFSEIKDDTWYRIFMVYRNGVVNVYVNDERVLEHSGDIRWEIDPWGFYFLTDEDGEMSDTHVAELAFWERSISDNEIREACKLPPVEPTPFIALKTSNVKVVDNLEFKVTIESNTAFTFDLPDWIEGVDITPFMGTHDYTFRAQPMEYDGRREGVITVKAEGVEPQEIKVEQLYVGDETPEPLGWWTFDNPNSLMYEEIGFGGATMSPAFKGADGPEKTYDAEKAGITFVPGPTEGNGAVRVPSNSYLWVNTATGLADMSSYTILYDVMLNDLNGYKSMLQTNVKNTSDASFFFKNNQLGRGGNLGYYGDFQTDVWYRILFVVKDGCPTAYVNGVKLSESNSFVSYDVIHNDEFLLFADEDGEEGTVNVASIRFWDVPLSEDMAKKLGDPYSDVEQLFVVQTQNVRLFDNTQFSININSNVPFTFQLPDWIEALDIEPVQGEKDYIFRAQPLEQEGRREGIVTVEAEDFDPVEVPVIQIKLGNEMPEPAGVWTFDDANDLLAGTGTAILKPAYKNGDGETEITDLETAEIQMTDGPLDGNGAIGINADSYLCLINNTGFAELKDFAIQFDIRPRTLQASNALYQANFKNNMDAGLFINKGMVGRNTNGLGYHGELTYMKWHRIFFVVRQGNASVYIDGDKVGQSTSPNTMWSMYPEVLLFADESGEESYNELCELRFWDVPLSDEQVKSLGGVEQDWEDDPFDDPTGVWTFDDPNNLLAGTGTATLKGAKRGAEGPEVVDDLAAIGIVPIEGPSAGNGAVTVPLDSYLQMAHNEPDPSQTSFTFLMDIRPKLLKGYNVLLQTDPTNRRDGVLFTKDTQIGINVAGLGYAEGLIQDKWQRIVFVVNDCAMTGVYIDGQKVNGTQTPQTDYWSLRDVCYIFADENGEEGPVDIAELQFWNVAISSAQVKAMGAAGTKTGMQQIPISRKLPKGIYDLTGRKISTPKSKLTKGVYIIDGKAVLVE